MIDQLDFEKGDGLLPAIIQDAQTKAVLMLGYMNREALKITLETGQVTFWSRSKNRLWTKGESSGNTLRLVSVQADCDHDTLLVFAHPTGPVCHTGTDTCFGTSNQDRLYFLSYLEAIIQERKNRPEAGSYTTSLFEKGPKKIAQKVGEEAVELILEVQDQYPELLLNEAADLLYHLLVLLQSKSHNLSEVIAVLQERH